MSGDKGPWPDPKTGAETRSEAGAKAYDEQDTVAVGPEEAAVEAGELGGDLVRSVGRHVVLEEIGRGGMGKVLRAYDPKLQREVALKRLRASALGRAGRSRFEQEAQAMAKLSHPNVVSVYDVEFLDDGQLVLVMEYVPGPTLRGWLRSAQRSWPEILGRFLAAGRGLAAAHAAGLLHRDFKPANVLLTDDSAKVTDFGLAKRTHARLATGPATGSGASADCGSSASMRLGEDAGEAADDDLTRAGEVMGTPRYMAPEQHRGKPLDAAVDQFAFCVACWEALSGDPPYAGKSMVKEKLSGPPPWPSSAGPRWLGEVLRRGLAPRADERWPDMQTLLRALGVDPAKRRAAWLRGAGAVGLMVMAGAAVYVTTRGGATETCSGGAALLDPAWGAAAQARIEQGMTGVDAPYAVSVWTRTRERIDAYTQRWADAHEAACESSARKEQSQALMDLRVGCLDQGRIELAAVAEVLAAADVDVLRNADAMLDGLPNIKRCSDLASLQEGEDPPDPGEAEAVQDIRRRIAAARAERSAGRYEMALAELTAADHAVERILYPPAHAEFYLERGQLLETRGAYAQAETALREALRQAADAHHYRVMRDASSALIHVVGGSLGRMDEALGLRELAEGLALGDPLPESNVRSSVAGVLVNAGQLTEAASEYRKVVALRTEQLGAEHRSVAEARSNLGTVLRQQGRFEEAEAEFREVLALLGRTLGDQHPAVATVRGNLASLLRVRGRLEESESEMRAALEVRVRALGSSHPLVASAKATLANILTDARRLDEAEAEARGALDVLTTALGREHPKTINALNSLGRVQYRRGDAAAAEASFRETVTLRVAAFGARHSSLGGAHLNVAVALRAQGKLEDAEREYLDAKRIWTAAHGPDHIDLASVHNNLGVLYQNMDNHVASEAQLRQALRIRNETMSSDDPTVLETRSNLAHALSGQQRHAEAEAERRVVLRGLLALREPDAPDLATARRLLAQVLLDRGKPAEALPLARQARDDVRAAGLSDVERGELGMTLALAMVAVDPSAGPEARPLVEEALQHFLKGGTFGEDGAREAREWLAR